MATIVHRGSHQWQARVRRKSYPPVMKTFETKAEAKRWARQVESEMDQGAYVSREEAKNTSFAEALTRYANEIAPRKKGARQERDRIEFLEFELGLDPMEVAAITGHKTLVMLKRYTHLRAEDLAQKHG